jgi:hypothetical protein
MTALMTTPATAALSDMHPKPATDRSRVGQLVLILKLAAFLLDLPATSTPWRQRRVKLLIDLPWRLPVTVRAVLVP